MWNRTLQNILMWGSAYLMQAASWGEVSRSLHSLSEPLSNTYCPQVRHKDYVVSCKAETAMSGLSCLYTGRWIYFTFAKDSEASVVSGGLL